MNTLSVGADARHENRVVPLAPRARLDPCQLAGAKVGFTARRVNFEDARGLLTQGRPRSGDLALARITRVVRHTRIQLVSGRRASLFEGDTIIAAYGARYATDQTEARVPEHLGPCHLVAAGGVIGKVQRWHDGLRRSTQVEPLGLLADAQGLPLNMARYGIPEPGSARAMNVILVVGTGMNSGKTTAAAHIIRGLTRLGYRAAGIKATGTGAGNDVWMYEDAGAALALDFSDAGFPSTYRIPTAELEKAYRRLTGHAAEAGMEFAVVEIADGLLQTETAALLTETAVGEGYSGLVVCAADALGAQAGVEWLERRGHRIDCVSGSITASPLASEEAAAVTRLPLASRHMLSDKMVLPRLLSCLGIEAPR